MAESIVLYVAVAVVLTITGYFASSKRQRDILLQRFLLRGRRASTATTPPRSLSPEKKVPNNGPPPTDYTDSFPPSQRGALEALVPSLLPIQRKKLIGHEVENSIFKQSIAPFEADFRQCNGTNFTATGFSIDEIKALGAFPDYAALSGVPLPAAYDGFALDKALARPYRPLRWAYHQTMCKFASADLACLLTMLSIDQIGTRLVA